jgi:hypothetical protein
MLVNCYNYLNLCSQEYERKQTSGPQPATRYRKKKVIKEVLPDDADIYEDPSSTLQLSACPSFHIPDFFFFPSDDSN